MADFEPATEFTGSREGFIFGRGCEGVGYYRDQGPNQNLPAVALAEIIVPNAGHGLMDGADPNDVGGDDDDDDDNNDNNDDDDSSDDGGGGGGDDNEVHLDPLEDPSDPDTRGQTYRAQSLCMNCHDDGWTTFYLTEVPHFRQIIISAFRCDHCGYSDTLVQPNSDIPTHGVKYKLSVTTPKDLNRQIVKSAYCTIKIPELGFVIPKESQASSLSTVEGVLQKATVALHESNAARREVDSEAADKVAEFVAQLALYASGSVGEDGVLLERPFTMEVEDPSGDSHVQGLAEELAGHGDGDPQLLEERYVRSVLENKMLGLFTHDELGTAKEAYTAPQGGTLTDNRIMQMYVCMFACRYECRCACVFVRVRVCVCVRAPRHVPTRPHQAPTARQSACC
jgi:ZPR1 zinc finger protein